MRFGIETTPLVGLRLVDPHSPWLNNPKLPCGSGCGERPDEGVSQHPEGGKEIIGTAEHDQTRTGFRGILKDIREVQIQRYEDARFGPAVSVERLVINPHESLVADSCDIMTNPA